MRSRLEELHRLVAEGQPGPLWLHGLRGLAWGASWLYGLGARAAGLGYDLGLRKPRRLPVPVVGVGNLSAGGAGKTPLTMAVVRALLELGIPAGVLSRGYGGSTGSGVRVVSVGRGPVLTASQAGDEPVLMAGSLPVPLAVGGDRYLAGRVLLAACGPRVLVGDDLFQHRRLHRDLDILALPADGLLDREHLLPRGNLREPLSRLRRAQAVVLTHADDPQRVSYARRWLRSFWGPGPVLACTHHVSGFTSLSGEELAPSALDQIPVLAFCGLARPRVFKRTLEKLGIEVRHFKAFGDHHAYTSSEIQDLWFKARELGARAMVTSQKDLVRLPCPPQGIKLYATRLELEFQGGDAALAGLLAWGLKDWKSAS